MSDKNIEHTYFVRNIALKLFFFCSKMYIVFMCVDGANAMNKQ